MEARQVVAMQFRLRTLMIVAGIGPPAIAFLWLHWGSVLFLAACIALLTIWVLISYWLAYFFARLVASVMN
jgi:hypothetical protein